jgi:hypothetical protein
VIVAEKYSLRQAQKVLGHQHLATTELFYVRDSMAPGLTDALF